MDPLILQKLQAFAARRRRLIILRGICSALAMLLATMMAVALLDRLFLMPDWLRWSLSGVAYVAVLVTEWRASVRLLLHLPGPRRLARLVEQTAPELREDLLSAVELGEGDARLDSPIFRELLQASVVKRMAGIEAQDLLPARLLQRSFLWLGGAVAALGVAFLIAGSPFASMLLRALLPLANLARISTIKVQILEPNPAEMPVPQGDSVPLTVGIGGGKVEKAWLETFSKTGGRNVIQMGGAGRDRFSASVQVAREDVEYRVRAGDAITRKYRLHAAARPHVVVFHKSYHYPAYTELPPKEVAEDTGDVAALEGTEVELRLETDQPVKAAELRLETSQSSSVVPLEKSAAGGLQAKVTLVSSGIYRVHLVAAESGFENKFSPEYELRATPDLIPQVEMTAPAQDMIASNRQTIEIAGTATDDLKVSTVEQMFKVNDKPWKSLPLAAVPGPKTTVHQLWDLSQEHLRAGDQVSVKLVAADQKGSRGESKPVQITLVESGFDPHRAEALAELVKLTQEMRSLRGTTEALSKRADEARQEFEKAGATTMPAASWALYGESLDAYEVQSSAVAAQLRKALPQTEPGGEAGNLVVFGRALARLDAGAVWMRAMQQSAADPAGAPYLRDAMRETNESAHRLEALTRRTEEILRVELALVETGLACENLQVLWQDQKPLAEQARRTPESDAAGWFKLASHYRVVLAEAVQIEDMLKSATGHVPAQLTERVRKAARHLEEQRSELDKAVTAEHPGTDLINPAKNYADTVTDSLNAMLEVAHVTAGHALRGYEEERREVLPAHTVFERVRAECNVVTNGPAPAALKPLQIAARWEALVSRWKKQGDWEELRPDADHYFVQQLRSLALALPPFRDDFMAMEKGKEHESFVKQFTMLESSFRVLECVHDLTELTGGLDFLAAEERWHGSSLRSRTAAPAAWFWIQNRLRSAPDELGKIEPQGEDGRKALEEARQILWRIFQNGPANPIDYEMNQRYNKERLPLPQERLVRETAQRVRDAIKLLQPAKESAEHALAEMAPQLADRLAQLAKDAAALKKDTEEHAKAQDQSPEAAKDQVKQDLAAQQKLTEQVEAVKDALRNDAQRQNLMKDEERERARDADDAVAMLREPPPRAEQALADAAAAEKPEERKDALQSAAAEQGKLASALDQLAKHFDALEKGTPEDTRMALREAEKAMGVKPDLDRQFAQSEQLAKAAEASPEGMLKKLEQALPANALMREKLSETAKDILNGASEKLAQASAAEEKVAKNVDQLAHEQTKAADTAKAAADAAKAAAEAAANANAPKTAEAAKPADGAKAPDAPKPGDAATVGTPPAAAPPEATAANTPAKPVGETPPPNPMLAQAAAQQPAIAAKAKDAAEQVQRAGRHEERLNHPEASEQLAKLGQQVQATGENEVPAAAEALAIAQAAAEAKAPVGDASEKLKGELGRLADAASGTPEHADAAPMPATSAAPADASATPPAGTSPAPGAPPPAPAAQGSQPPSVSPAAATPPISPQTAAAAPPGAELPLGSESPMANVPAPGAPASPQQQVWMARALDALDAALHAQPNPPMQEGAGDQKGQSAGEPKGQTASQAMAEAQQAMSEAAKAAAAAMSASRSEAAAGTPKSATAKGGEQAASKTGAKAAGDGSAYGALPKAGAGRTTDWGKLPKKMAEQLTQGQREGVSSEYKNQVETYYRVIAERARKP